MSGTGVSTWQRRGAAVALGLVVDRAVGDPPDRWHPVAWFGAAMAALERLTWRDHRAAGVAHTAIGVVASTLAGAAGPMVAAKVAAGAGRTAATTLATVAATATTVGGASLDRAAAAVATALDNGGVGQARTLLPALVGRDPTGLDEAEIARAVVESVAENVVDAVVAPALWCLVAGAPGATGYRAVNTLDAMIGHRSPRYERFGWAAARLDDAANLVPARATAAAVALVRPHRAAQVWRAVRTDAPAHPSPNAGVAEAAFAAALGLRLGGRNTYAGRVDVRPPLGDGRPAAGTDIARARRLARDVTVALAAATAAPAIVRTVRARRGR